MKFEKAHFDPILGPFGSKTPGQVSRYRQKDKHAKDNSQEFHFLVPK